MRIGTWNLEGRWTPRHLTFLGDLGCDVLLLTEVASVVRPPGFRRHLTGDVMSRGRAWAGVLSRSPLLAAPDPHAASALSTVDGICFCSSVLPWRASGEEPPWSRGDVGDRVDRVLSCLGPRLTHPLVWGGDFNHALEGPERAGSRSGRASILGFLDDPVGLGPHPRLGGVADRSAGRDPRHFDGGSTRPAGVLGVLGRDVGDTPGRVVDVRKTSGCGG